VVVRVVHRTGRPAYGRSVFECVSLTGSSSEDLQICDETLQNARQNDKTNPSQDRGGTVKEAAPSAWSMPTQPKGPAVSFFKVTKKLPPGTPGVRKLLQRFGWRSAGVRSSSCHARRRSPVYHLRTGGGAASSSYAFVPTHWWEFRLVMAKRLCNHRSMQPAECGTLRLACGNCRSVQPGGWVFPTA
jgi:hypothetical protein